MRLRKDVNVYLYRPSARLFHIVVELENVPGALHSVLATLRDLHLNVLGSFSSVDDSSGTGVWSGFVEDSQQTESELRKSLASTKHVRDVLVSVSKKGFLVDAIHYPLSWNTGDRAVMMRAQYLVRMFDRIREELGSGGEVVAYDEGFAYGRETWKNFAARFGEGFVRSNLAEMLLIYQALGWFKLEGVSRSRGDRTVKVVTSGSFECESRKFPRPYSQFVRGHLSGALTAILGDDMTCEEMECMASGGSHCEFVLRHNPHA